MECTASISKTVLLLATVFVMEENEFEALDELAPFTEVNEFCLCALFSGGRHTVLHFNRYFTLIIFLTGERSSRTFARHRHCAEEVKLQHRCHPRLARLGLFLCDFR